MCVHTLLCKDALSIASYTNQREETQSAQIYYIHTHTHIIHAVEVKPFLYKVD